MPEGQNTSPKESDQSKNQSPEGQKEQDHSFSILKIKVLNKNGQPTLTTHIVLSLSLIVITAISYCTMYRVASGWESEWLDKVPNNSSEEYPLANQLDASSQDKERKRLMAQFDEIESRSERHKTIMSFFYKQYYISLSMMGFAASIGSLCLIFISKHGWEKINNAILNIFCVSAGVVVFYGNLTVIFQQEENLKASQDIYLGYIDLRQEMLSYLATLRNRQGEELAPYQYINYIDDQLKKLNQVRLGFDPSRISNFIERFEEASNPQNETPNTTETSNPQNETPNTTENSNP